ncbi:MAG: hypothetical protein H6956_08175 [Chromatiaceae bacterium]|nr:hypothetical protein [Gammaproteobacteria bacterium]MCP5317885.1 hypothetical protein [Chromatiaceae bacterium]MCP5429103.1 hypothetical protein [Chromatiaceae bacterium]MCP5434643.1 hypothetical protein [Chromatiaceae bacterium]HOP17495.1 hypothetical protein [Gammaproteobacteria bacterium]
MNPLYRMRPMLPSLTLALCLAVLLSGCDSPPAPPPRTTEPVSNVYLEALQQAEAVKHDVEQRNLEQQRIDDLLGRGQAPAR